MSEPNLALNLEICDYVNAKQGSVPREAAIAVVKLINQRDPQTLELALHLLDNLVKNCGYPFQLQVSRKEFLNELVKRFPERPLVRYDRVQRLILAQIEEWYQTICKTSKYKEDFGYIRDMHRLLANKGYVFPEVKLEDAAVLNPSDTLKSLDEIQKEEAVVHSAKLQEFIRRGKPQDLQEANKLMKIMAGFKDDNVEENKRQVSDDVARLKRKTEIFAEMLNTIQANGAAIDDSNETVVDLYGSIKSSQPIVTRIIELDSDNEQYVQELLGLNDVINQLVEKFQLLKHGHVDQAGQIKVSGGAAGASAAKELNLIDFDDEPISADTKDEQGYQDLLSDLSNLAFDAPATPAKPSQVNPLDFFGSGGSISLGQNLRQPTPAVALANVDLFADLHSPSPQLQSNTAQPAPAQLDPFGFNFPTSTPAQIQTQAVATKTIYEGSVKIEADTFASSARSHHGKFYITNTQGPVKLSLKFMVAVPRGCKLDLRPQNKDVIYPLDVRGFQQEFFVENPEEKPLKVKWKVVYTEAGAEKTETGTAVLA